jgi:radical SAM protein with 4Fe4S-binding SPASM domain
MANLSITAACNRSCAYCFAGRERSAEAGHMPEETFVAALDFLVRSDIDEARLLGGEPTLHPDFVRFGDLALDRGLKVLVFSNGLAPERALSWLANAPQGRVSVLLNADPSESSQHRAMARLGPRLALGVNIDRPAFAPELLLDLVGQYGLAPTIRFGLAHPIVGGRNARLHPRQFTSVGHRLAAFAPQARACGVTLSFDCGFVPCMFPSGFFTEFGESRECLGQRCSPVLDILPDENVVACYPLAALHRERLTAESTATDLRARFSEHFRGWREVGITPVCDGCAWRRRGSCTGGCIATAIQRSNGLQSLEQSEAVGLAAASRTWSPRDTSHHTTHEAASPRRDATRPVPPGETVKAGRTSGKQWSVPYIDQPVDFWERLHAEFGDEIGDVYFPLPASVIASGRPPQPSAFLDDFLRRCTLPRAVLLNPIVLPQRVDALIPRIVETLRRLMGDCGVTSATVSSYQLAVGIRDRLPQLPLTASTLMDVSQPNQAMLLDGICDTLVPSSRVMRDLPALRALRAAFRGRIRLIVNEGCLSGCPFRTQHFYEMTSGTDFPASLCDDLLRRHPWLRLTGSWVLPQHLRLLENVVDEWKLAGRVTLRDPVVYRRTLRAYVTRTPLGPHEIGGGPASLVAPMHIEEDFFLRTLHCGRHCHRCSVCRDYWPY